MPRYAREKDESGARQGGQDPIEPGDTHGLRFVEALQHLRPEVAAEFGVSHGRDGLFEKIAQSFVVIEDS